MINHVPVIGTIGIALLALVAWMRRSPELLRTALLFAVANAVAAVPAYLTGDGAEDVVRRLPDVSRTLIDQHEDVALVATIAAVALGVAALIALLVFRRRTPPRWLAGATLAAACVPIVFMGWAANLGGQIRHTEIRSGTAAVTVTPSAEESPTSEH